MALTNRRNWALVTGCSSTQRSLDGNLMDWAFFRVEVPAPHAKLPTGDEHHSLRRRFHDVRPANDDISQGSLLPTSTTFCRAWHTTAAGWILGERNIVAVGGSEPDFLHDARGQLTLFLIIVLIQVWPNEPC